MKFRVVHGIHSEGGRIYEQGEIVDSKADLNRLNQPGAVKFVQVSDTEAAVEAIQASTKAEPSVGANVLEAMTLEQLRELAAEEEIDLGNATRKADVIAVIRAAQQG